MLKENNKKKLKLTPFEIVWYVLCALLFLWGLTYIILGLIGKYLPIEASKNYIQQASDNYAKTFKMGFFPYGLIRCGVAWLLALIVLLVFSRKTDREYEKEQRRAALRASARKNSKVVEDEDLVSETPVQEETPVEEAPVEETPVEEAPVKEAPIEEEKSEETPAEEKE